MLKRIFIAIIVSAACLVASSNAAAQSALRVGAAKVDVTRWSSLPPVTPKYEHQRVNVRAIVIDNGATRAALISIPGSNFDWPAISKQVAAELNWAKLAPGGQVNELTSARLTDMGGAATFYSALVEVAIA